MSISQILHHDSFDPTRSLVASPPAPLPVPARAVFSRRFLTPLHYPSVTEEEVQSAEYRHTRLVEGCCRFNVGVYPKEAIEASRKVDRLGRSFFVNLFVCTFPMTKNQEKKKDQNVQSASTCFIPKICSFPLQVSTQPPLATYTDPPFPRVSCKTPPPR